MYSHIAEHHGKPESISENGFNLLFTKSKMSKNITMVHMSLEGLQVKTNINFVEKMENYLEKLISEKDPRGAGMEFFWKNYLHKCKDMTDSE